MVTQLAVRKQWKHLYAPSTRKVELVAVPEFKFVMIDGRIEPGEAPGTSPGFGEAMAALYGAAYTLKFMSKLRKEDPIDYPVMALEGLWWVEEGHRPSAEEARERLDRLHEQGPTADAFTFTHVFDPPGLSTSPEAAPTAHP